jgi:glycosyltransferase involved in cell wall biosynthesis
MMPIENSDDAEEEDKTQAVSISRIDFNKNIEILLDANKRVRNNPVKIYGWPNKKYVYQKLDHVAFNQYYQGKYVKSFDATSEILKKAKFMIDLSSLPNDGGGRRNPIHLFRCNLSQLCNNTKPTMD